MTRVVTASINGSGNSSRGPSSASEYVWKSVVSTTTGTPHAQAYPISMRTPSSRLGAMQDGHHRVDPTQAFTVQLEETSSLDIGDQLLLVGVAERQEDAVRADLGGQALGEVGGQDAVVCGEEPVSDVVHRVLPTDGSGAAGRRNRQGRRCDVLGGSEHCADEGLLSSGASGTLGAIGASQRVVRSGHVARCGPADGPRRPSTAIGPRSGC